MLSFLYYSDYEVTHKCLWGRVKISTDGIVHEPLWRPIRCDSGTDGCLTAHMVFHMIVRMGKDE